MSDPREPDNHVGEKDVEFSDDDLKRLKELSTQWPMWRDEDTHTVMDILPDLLARLEAAEKCIFVTYNSEELDEYSDDYKAWCKVAGK